MDKFVKTFSAEMKVEPGSREVVAIISTDSIDRDGEVVMPKGMKRKNYGGNPVVFYNHDYANSLPIGKALWVKADVVNGKSVLKAKTYISDKTQLANDVFGLMQDGVLSAFSIGFRSNSETRSAPTPAEIKKYPHWEGARAVHRDWELLEYSVVGIPANPEALALAVAKGYSADTIKWLSSEKNEGTQEAEAESEKVVEVKAVDANAIRLAFYQTLLKRLRV